MENNLIVDFLQFHMKEISQESISLFTDLVTLKFFPKNHVIIKEDIPLRKFFVIKSGIIGSFSKDADGNKEFIRAIHTKKNVFANISALDESKATLNSYKCLTDCEIYEGNFVKFKEYIDTNKEFSILYGKIMETSLVRSQMRIDELSLLDATERYKALKSNIPNIENLIPQYQIAYYLNITPVQLSRIRKKLYSS